MKQLITVEAFTDGLPPGWMETARHWSVRDGALDTGKVCTLCVPIPGNGWESLKMEWEVDCREGSAAVFGWGGLNVTLNLSKQTVEIHTIHKENLASAAIPETIGGRFLIGVECDRKNVRIRWNAQVLLSAARPWNETLFGYFDATFWGGWRVHSFRLCGEHERERRHSFSRRPDDPGLSGFHLEACVDFADDLMHAPWHFRHFDQLFAELKSWGVRRCHWIYYGSSRDGWWQGAPGTIGVNAVQTMRNVGEIFPAAVEAAHRHGVEIHALLKPFDMGFACSHGEGTAGAEKNLRIGGPVQWIADFPANHPELLMRRKPGAWGPEKETITRIDLVKEDGEAAGFGVDALELWVSDDNATYRRYDGPLTRSESVEAYPLWEPTPSGGKPTGQKRVSRIMRLEGLDLSNRYFALSVPSRTGTFANNLINLVHLFSESGEIRRHTYGVSTRRVKLVPGDAAMLRSGPTTFQASGVEFDYFPGTPTAVFPRFNALSARHLLDAGEGYLAIAQGKDPGPIAALSPSFAATREWWLSWLEEALKAGADGIELRVRNHHAPFTWEEFGFESPVRDEFLVRHGVDLWATDDFDREAWRRLRGEGYTQFLREAKKLACRHGKPMGIHVSPTLEMHPRLGSAMGIHWDWRAWIDEGLADSVTMKEIRPGSLLAEKVLSHTRRKGIPVIYSPYANQLWGTEGGERVVSNWIELARRHGYNGYQLYECAGVFKIGPEGDLLLRQPPLRQILSRSFGKSEP